MTKLCHALPALLGLMVALTAACAGDPPGGAAATRSPEPSAPPIWSASLTATSTPSASSSATQAASRTPAGLGGGAPVSSATPPAGYASSCAKDVPWGRQVSRPFICLESPTAGARVARGGSVTVSGYAGGSFEHNVVNEVRALGGREPGARLAMTPATYSAPDIGMPGAWRVTLTIPATATTGPARVTAHFDSPRDGSVVAQATVDIVIE